MKCILFKSLFMFFLLGFTSTCSKALLAQSVIQIGAGTNNGVYPLYSPLYRFSAASGTTNCRSNILFTKEELAAAGIPAGSIITSIAFEKLSERYFLIPPAFKILMANTNNITLSTTTTWTSILQTHATVYSNNTFNLPPVTGWVTWNLSPFEYSGNALEIATDLVMAGANATTGFWGWRYTENVPTDRIIGATGTTTAPEILNGVNVNYKLRPDIRITFTPPVPTPLTLLDFTARTNENNVVLFWKTSHEDNVSHFEIECSVNGSLFNKVASMGSSGETSLNTNNYSYTDTKKEAGRYYYRLKMVDKDGSTAYSGAVTVDVVSRHDISLTSFSYNPAGQQLAMVFDMKKQASVTVGVTDVNGRKVLPPKIMILPRGRQAVTLDNLSSLIKGVYWVKIIFGKESMTRGFIK